MINELIDKQDNFEIVRDRIAQILANESANQMILADGAGENPELWKLRVFKERTNPWEQFLNEQTDKSPIINVWFDGTVFNKSASDSIESQKSEATFNIDIIGLAVSENIVGGGHIPGDEAAAYNLQRGLRLVRNIIMSAQYRYLDFPRGLVWDRWIDSVSIFQPTPEEQAVQKVVGGRISLKVDFNEYAPQFQPETLEFISVDVHRSEDGQIVAEADYDYNS